MTTPRWPSWMDALEEGVMLLDPNGRIIYENQKSRELLPGPGSHLWERNRSPQVFQFIRQVVQEGEAYTLVKEPHPMALRGVREGKEIWVSVLPRPDLILIENQQRLFSQISHELRTPLSNIKMAYELLQAGQMPLPTFQETLERNLQRMETLIELLSRQRKVEVWLPQFTLKNWCEEVRTILQAFSPRLRAATLTVSTECDPALHRAPLDPFLLSTILFPLLDNAVRYNVPHGKIWIRVKQTDQTVVLEVEDTGRGIPPSIIDKVFEPFVQFEGGTGLGLSLVHMAVKRWGGKVSLTSEEGKGTRVHITLPLPHHPQ